MVAPRAASPGTAIRRGDIWWVDFEPTQGAEIRKTRPAVVITADALNRARRTVVVVPLSTGPEPHPPVVVATPSAGARSVAVCDQLRAVGVEAPRERLVGHLGVALDVRFHVAGRQRAPFRHEERHQRELADELVGVV